MLLAGAYQFDLLYVSNICELSVVRSDTAHVLNQSERSCQVSTPEVLEDTRLAWKVEGLKVTDIQRSSNQLIGRPSGVATRRMLELKPRILLRSSTKFRD